MLKIKNIVPPTGEDFEKAIKKLYEINDIPYEETDSFWEVGNGDNAAFYIGDDDIEMIASSIKETSKVNVLKNIPVEITLVASFDVWDRIEKYASNPYIENVVYTFQNDSMTGKLKLTYLDIMKIIAHKSSNKEWKAFKKELICLPYAYRIFEED